MFSRKKIAIVGTSTSIMRAGYAPSLEKILHGSDITNYSLGGAPSTYGCYVMEKENVAERYDIAIIDFCINDQQLERNGFMPIEEIVSAFGALLAYFKPTSRCRPLVILFPQRKAFTDARLMKVRKLILALCRRRGIAVVDVFDLVEKANALFGTDRDTFFQDWAHMRSDHAPAFSRLLSKAILNLKPPKPIGIEFPKYRIAVPSSLPSVRRGTSLMSADTYVLTSPAETKLPMNGYLCGFLHWHNHDTGTLLLTAADQRLALPARKISPWNNRFAFSLFPSAVPCGDALLTVGTDSGFALAKSFGYSKELPTDGSEIAFCGFIVANEDPKMAGKKAIRRLQGALKTKRLSIAEHRFVRYLSGVSPMKQRLSMAAVRVESLVHRLSKTIRRFAR